MHALVIGGTRFVGYLAAWRLLAGGHRVTLVNRGTRPDPFGNRIERLRGDRRTDLGRLVAGRRFDAVLDLAGYDADDARGAIAALGGRIGHYVFVSSGQVYLVGNPAAGMHAAREQDYDVPLAPRPTDPVDAAEWDYGAGKRAAEDALAAAPGFPFTVLRIPMVHGERDYNRRLEGYLWRLLDGGPLLVPGAERRVRHVYGAAVARTLVAVAEKPPTGSAFNLAQRETPTLGELIAVLGEAIGARATVLAPPEAALVGAGLVVREVSPLSTRWMSFLDPARAERELGFTHEPLATYLGHIAASFLAHPPDAPPPALARRPDELALARTLG
jgi:nucleoside-diphosphate-sugar epimerase